MAKYRDRKRTNVTWVSFSLLFSDASRWFASKADLSFVISLGSGILTDLALPLLVRSAHVSRNWSTDPASRRRERRSREVPPVRRTFFRTLPSSRPYADLHFDYVVISTHRMSSSTDVRLVSQLELVILKSEPALPFPSCLSLPLAFRSSRTDQASSALSTARVYDHLQPLKGKVDHHTLAYIRRVYADLDSWFRFVCSSISRLSRVLLRADRAFFLVLANGIKSKPKPTPRIRSFEKCYSSSFTTPSSGSCASR